MIIKEVKKLPKKVLCCGVKMSTNNLKTSNTQKGFICLKCGKERAFKLKEESHFDFDNKDNTLCYNCKDNTTCEAVQAENIGFCMNYRGDAKHIDQEAKKKYFTGLNPLFENMLITDEEKEMLISNLENPTIIEESDFNCDHLANNLKEQARQISESSGGVKIKEKGFKQKFISIVTKENKQLKEDYKIVTKDLIDATSQYTDSLKEIKEEFEKEIEFNNMKFQNKISFMKVIFESMIQKEDSLKMRDYYRNVFDRIFY